MSTNIIQFFSYLLPLLLSLSSFGQASNTSDQERQVLLLDLSVQVECNDAIDDMYNFDFEYAERQFRWLRKKYDWHPLPYFLMGLSQWWKILPDIKNESYDRQFFALMDSSLEKSKYVYENVNEIEGAFFLASTYGFIGRLYSERKEYRKAAFAGKKALKYLKVCRGNEAFSPEILFGDALFNYYAEWIPDNYPLLRPIMALFPKGNLKLGLQQLREVTRNAFYTRTEAMYFLMRILDGEEHDYYGALEVVKRLTESYPNNSYFHRYYTRLLYQLGRFSQAETESLSILNRIDSSYFGYEANGGRYASFYLGQIYASRKKDDLAKTYYIKCLRFSEQVDAQKGGYYQHALFNMAKITEKEKDYQAAIDYYRQTEKFTSRKSSINRVSKTKIKKLKKILKSES